MPQCAGIKRDGGRCAVVVGPGQSHCYAHDPERSQERKRNASRGGRSKGHGELGELKKQIKDLTERVLSGELLTNQAAVANQLINTRLRAIEQERKMKELEELAMRLEALEGVLKGKAHEQERLT
jgi:hypothetical protein